MNYTRFLFLILIYSSLIATEKNDSLSSSLAQVTISTHNQQNMAITLVIAFAKGFIPGLLCSFTGCVSGFIPSPSHLPKDKHPEFAVKVIGSSILSYHISSYYKQSNEYPILTKTSQLFGIYVGTVCGIGIATTINSRRV